MATTQVTANDQWQTVVNDTDDFLIENASSKVVHVAFVDVGFSASAYHTLQPGQVLVRVGGGEVHVRCVSGDANVVVTK